MITSGNREDCCGCTACAFTCPHNAISMKPDALGFLYPIVDTEKCIDCGACENVCSFNDNYDKLLNLTQPDAWAARHKDINEVMKSRSGAVFAAISDYILKKDGVVYGAGYKDHFRVAHKRAMSTHERDEFRGSKYVQSDLENIFKQVKDDLKNGLTVLFSGTPCQTAGLNSFIGKKYRENLLLVDIVCHGVGSPYIWRDYIRYLEDSEKDTIVRANFRDKEKYGWEGHRESFVFNNGYMKSWTTFTQVFYKHIMFRHSCGNCHFCNMQRPSDITLADFWGWEKSVPEMNNDNKGLNLVLCNTKKGQEIFDTIKNDLMISPVNLDECIQPNLQYPSVIHPKRDQFEDYYVRHGFISTMKRYGDIGWRYKIRHYCWWIYCRLRECKSAFIAKVKGMAKDKKAFV